MSRISKTESTSSINSAKKFGLDEKDNSSILVYHSTVLVSKHCKGLDVSSQEDLCKTLDKDPSLRVTRKRIPRGYSSIEVKREDLWNDEEKRDYSEYPNSKCSLACISLPRSVWFKRILFDQYRDLYIISPEISFLNGSSESSQYSLSTSWNRSVTSNGDSPQRGATCGPA